MNLAVDAGDFALAIQEHAGVVELGLGRVFGQVQRHHDVGLVPPGGGAQHVQDRAFQRQRGLLGRALHLARDGGFGQSGNVQADMVFLPGRLAHRVDERRQDLQAFGNARIRAPHAIHQRTDYDLPRRPRRWGPVARHSGGDEHAHHARNHRQDCSSCSFHRSAPRLIAASLPASINNPAHIFRQGVQDRHDQRWHESIRQ